MKKLAAFGAWLVGTIFFGGLSGSHIVPQLVELYDLSKFNKTVQGEIVEVNMGHYNNLEYVNTERTCCKHSIGESITIYISPNNPNISQDYDPLSVFINDVIAFVLTLTTLQLIAAGIINVSTKQSEGYGRFEWGNNGAVLLSPSNTSQKTVYYKPTLSCFVHNSGRPCENNSRD